MKNFKKLSIALITIIAFASCTSEPQANFIMSSEAIDDNNDPIVGEEISFENLSIDADAYKWNFDDGEESNEKNPEHIYEKGGEYEVSLSASNKKGSETYTTELNVLSLDGDWECTSIVTYSDGVETYNEILEIEQEGNELEGELEGEHQGVDIEDAEVDEYEVSFTATYNSSTGIEIWVYEGEINEDYDEMEGEITIIVNGTPYTGFTWSAEKENNKSVHVKGNSIKKGYKF